METALIWHKLPELPVHSCKCICIMSYSSWAGVEFYEYSAKHQRFNASDTNAKHAIPTSHVYAWAEIKLPSDLIQWAEQGHEDDWMRIYHESR